MPAVYITGIPRSGSTWAFNIARLSMYEVHGAVAHYNEVQYRNAIAIPLNALVKTHAFISSRSDDSLVIHSTRHYGDAARSWRRMSPHITASPDYLQELDKAWRPHANIMFHHAMLADPAVRLCVAWSISRLIGVESYEKAVEISREVDALPLPTKRIDPITFLQPRHRSQR